MGEEGFAYVPRSCQSGASCKLMVTLHGCYQYFGLVGNALMDKAYPDEYADTNDLIVLCPQATTMNGNPRGCWDWWGYESADDAQKSGPQMAAVVNMAEALGAGGSTGTPALPAPTGLASHRHHGLRRLPGLERRARSRLLRRVPERYEGERVADHLRHRLHGHGDRRRYGPRVRRRRRGRRRRGRGQERHRHRHHHRHRPGLRHGRQLRAHPGRPGPPDRWPHLRQRLGAEPRPVERRGHQHHQGDPPGLLGHVPTTHEE